VVCANAGNYVMIQAITTGIIPVAVFFISTICTECSNSRHDMSHSATFCHTQTPPHLAATYSSIDGSAVVVAENNNICQARQDLLKRKVDCFDQPGI
jgi:hypothetical protein